MATLSFLPQLTGFGGYTTGTISARQDSIALGQNTFVATLPSLTYGNAATLVAGQLQCNDWYRGLLTITAGSTTSIDLNGGSYTNPFGTTLAWTFLKLVVIAIQSPDGAAAVRIGPQGVSLAAQLWFGGVTSVCYDTEYFTFCKVGPLAGWPLVGGVTDLLPIKNPGASSVSVAVFLAGGS